MIRVLVIICLGILLQACATAPTVGVRPDFTDRKISTVTLTAAFAATNFSQNDVRPIEKMYEQEVGRFLTKAGIGWQALELEQETDELIMRLLRERPLAGRFEAGGNETRELAELNAARAAPAEAFLLVEVVYHTETKCAGNPQRYNARSSVFVAAGAPTSGPRPCVVSHLDAVLLDGRTGQVMWRNVWLREHHAAQILEAQTRENVVAVIEHLLGSEIGIKRLVHPVMARNGD